jgi:hypothetical protein
MYKRKKMKEIELNLYHAEIQAMKEGFKVKAFVDIQEVLSLFTVQEIEENIEQYEKLFLLMKDYYRKVEQRDEEFFK